MIVKLWVRTCQGPMIQIFVFCLVGHFDPEPAVHFRGRPLGNYRKVEEKYFHKNFVLTRQGELWRTRYCIRILL